MNPRQPAAGRLRHLAGIHIFSGLSDDELAGLSSQISSFACQAGRLLYAPGECAQALYLLSSGHVQLYRLSPNGRKLVVARVQAGAFFGAIPPVSQETYQTYAESINDCMLYVLSRADTERLLREKPQVALRVVAAFGDRLRRLEWRLEAMAFQNISARLAALLLRLADEQDAGHVLGYTHQHLADMLGVYRETVSDALNKFKADGLVQTGRKEVSLEDRRRLKTVADS
jgi:CRP-like cAMP-binding protein